MRKIILLSVLLALGSSAQAQVAKWVTRPAYDGIRMAKGAPLMICDSLNMRVLYDLDGKRLSATPDSICDFRENKAVTLKRGTKEVTGFYDVKGKFIPLKGVTATYDYPYFSDGHLLVQKGTTFTFINKDGHEDNFGSYVTMYPFNNGYAACHSFENLEKMKGLYYNYVKVDKSTVDFKFEDKFYPLRNIKYISSINDEGVGIVLLKKKVFLYHAENMTLERLFADPDEESEKKQVCVDDDLEECLKKEGEDYALYAMNGKKEVVKIIFDKLFRPRSIIFSNRTILYKEKDVKEKEYDSALEILRSSKDKLGLLYQKKTVLPEQFDNVSYRFGNKAVVCSNGKWGVLEVLDVPQPVLKMNKGNDIAFRHQKFETTIRLDLPVEISSAECRFDVAPKKGCLIDKTSLQTRDTESGNYVEYNCVLTIPESLPDVLTEIVYPVTVTYDGLQYPEMPLKVKAWHYKYLTLDLNDEEIVFEKGNAAFTFDLIAEKRQGEGDYPLKVEVDTEGTMTPMLEKVSETRYTCKTYNLVEGINDLTVRILEAGCPPMEIPIEVIYTPKAPRRRVNGVMKPATKEGVVVRKKGEVVLEEEEIKEDIKEVSEEKEQSGDSNAFPGIVKENVTAE